MDKAAAKQKFVDEFSGLVQELKEILVQYNMPQEAVLDWFIKKSSNISVCAARGLSVIDTYCILKNKSLADLSQEEYKKVAILGSK
ncbi:Farnesyl pyrophosphate synthetase [Clavispora lusitaniae]|nr:Farnesyl pyrophosphate synthetase [Clavispora lusitaniae]